MNQKIPSTITVGELSDHGCPPGFCAWIETHAGRLRVGYIQWPQTNPWAYCPKGNGGFGQSFMVDRGMELILLPEGWTEEVEKSFQRWLIFAATKEDHPQVTRMIQGWVRKYPDILEPASLPELDWDIILDYAL